MVNNKRGQAALEFLTTYGWAFMVILVMIGALAYFGVLNPQNLIPDQCSITSGFTCRDSEITATQVSLILINNMGEQVELSAPQIQRNNVQIDTGCEWQDAAGVAFPPAPPPVIVQDGQEYRLVCQIANLGVVAGGKAKLGYNYAYQKTTGGFDHAVTGTLTATVR